MGKVLTWEKTACHMFLLMPAVLLINWFCSPLSRSIMAKRQMNESKQRRGRSQTVALPFLLIHTVSMLGLLGPGERGRGSWW